MRLTPEQIVAIKSSAHEIFGADTNILLFGSRIDDQKSGGDIDLLIRPLNYDQILARKIQFLTVIERKIGTRKIDLVIEYSDDPRPIIQIARATGIVL